MVCMASAVVSVFKVGDLFAKLKTQLFTNYYTGRGQME